MGAELRRAGQARACNNCDGAVSPAVPGGRWDGSGVGLNRVEHAVAGLFGGFQSIAEIQELILQRAAAHVVDRSAYVANQSLEFEGVHWDDFDVMTRFTGLQCMFNSFERISVSK